MGPHRSVARKNVMSEGPEGLHVDERRLAAILAADVAGYSRLMGHNEEETVRDLEAHQAVVLPLIARHGGAIINIAGDGIVAQFPSAVRAVECAVAIQKSMAERNFDVPAERRMLLRIGVNLGDIIHDGTRTYGDGINVAARLEPIAEPGSICISATVREAIFGKLGLPLRDLGEKTLKNIDRPVHIYQIQSRGRVPATTGSARVCANIAGLRRRSGSPFSSPPSRASARGASGHARRSCPTIRRSSRCFPSRVPAATPA
jgi:class 3 adenylate cyclase